VSLQEDGPFVHGPPMNTATLAICNAYARFVRRRQLACDYGSDPSRRFEPETLHRRYAADGRSAAVIRLRPVRGGIHMGYRPREEPLGVVKSTAGQIAMTESVPT
jgi:hypothetical protein